MKCRCVLLASLGLPAISASVLPAQRVECIAPTGCATAARGSHYTVIVKAVDAKGNAAPKAVIAFTASDGTIDKTVTADDRGIAVVDWAGNGSNAQVAIQAVGVIDGASVLSSPITLGTPYKISNVFLSDSHWYEGLQLRKPIEITIANTTATNCAQAAVAFRALDEKAHVAPDTAWGVWSNDRCLAKARWTLAEQVGEQSLGYALVGQSISTNIATATSRKLPWLAIALATTTTSDYVRLSEKKRTLHITRKTLSAGGQDSVAVEYDSTGSVIDSVAKTWVSFAPVAGIDWPLYLRWKDVRLFTGADLTSPTNNWFVGISVLQYTAGWQHEAVPMDILLVGRISRRNTLMNPEACALDAKVCDEESRTRIVGGGLLIAFNTSDALGKLATALGVK